MQLKHRTTYPSRHAAAPIGLGVAWTLLRQSRLPTWLRGRGPHQRGPLRSRRQFCFAPCAGWLTVHGRRHHGEVGPLSGGVMSPCGSTPIRPITGRRSLPPSSFTRRPIGSSCESLSLAGRASGLPRSADVPRWVGSPLSAGGASSAPGELRAPGPDHMPFWPERISIFRSLIFTTFIAASPGLTRPPDPGPRPLRCSQSRRRLALSPPSRGRRIRCPGGLAPLRCRRRTPR
jgi:hypothetical protein